MKRCKWFGHNWEPVFIKGKIGTLDIKFIGCYCKRCRKGNRELLDVSKLLTETNYVTYRESYFDEITTGEAR
jgi:hypothetical protein